MIIRECGEDIKVATVSAEFPSEKCAETELISKVFPKLMASHVHDFQRLVDQPIGSKALRFVKDLGQSPSHLSSLWAPEPWLIRDLRANPWILHQRQ